MRTTDTWFLPNQQMLILLLLTYFWSFTRIFKQKSRKLAQDTILCELTRFLLKNGLKRPHYTTLMETLSTVCCNKPCLFDGKKLFSGQHVDFSNDFFELNSIWVFFKF